MSYKKYVSVHSENDTIVHSYNDINKSEVENNWLLADSSYIQRILKNLTGKILTIIDASISDLRQNKAIKDLIKKDFMEALVDASTELNPISQNTFEEIQKGSIAKPVSVDEILADK